MIALYAELLTNELTVFQEHGSTESTSQDRDLSDFQVQRDQMFQSQKQVMPRIGRGTPQQASIG